MSAFDQSPSAAAEAAGNEVVRPRPDAVAEAIARSEVRFRNAGAFEPVALVRRERDQDHRT